MSAKRTRILISHASESLQTAKDILLKPKSKPRDECVAISRFFDGLGLGNRQAFFDVKCDNGDDTAGTQTFTVSSGAAADTAVIAGTTLTCVDHRETTNVTFGADSSGSLNSKYFTFQDQPGLNKYYLWFNINSAGVDPAPAGKGTGIVVAGATGATAATLATAAVAACASVAGLKVTAGASGHIITTNTAPGVATATADGTATSTGFTFTRSITGSAVTAAQYQVYATDTLTAADLARAINANTTTLKYVTAANVAGVVTVTGLVKEYAVNLITTTASGNVTAGGATLTGAAPATGITTQPNVYHAGY